MNFRPGPALLHSLSLRFPSPIGGPLPIVSVALADIGACRALELAGQAGAPVLRSSFNPARDSSPELLEARTHRIRWWQGVKGRFPMSRREESEEGSFYTPVNGLTMVTPQDLKPSCTPSERRTGTQNPKRRKKDRLCQLSPALARRKVHAPHPPPPLGTRQARKRHPTRLAPRRRRTLIR